MTTASNERLVAFSVRIPRLASAALLWAIFSHIRAAVEGLGPYYWFPAWHWALLAAAEVLLLLVMLERPDYFRLREFRMGGFAVVFMSLMILAPLAPVVRRYGDQLPLMMVLSIALGVVSFALVFLLSPRNVESRSPQQPSNRGEFLLVGGIVVAAAALFPIWLRSLGAIPLTQLLTGQATGVEIALARQGALSELASLPLRVAVGVVRKLYLLFAVGWLVADWVRTPRAEWRDRTMRRHLAWFAVVVAAAFALVTTERAVLGQVGVVAVIAALVVNRRQLSGRMVAAMVAIIAAFPLLFGFANSVGAGTANPIGVALESVRRRVFFLPADVLAQYFASFPGRRDFLGGTSIPKLSYVTGGQTFDLSGYVYEVAYKFDDRIAGSANGSFLGVGWANFGTVGVVLWCVAAAIGIVWLERVLHRLPPRSSAALRGLAAVQVVFLTSADIWRTVIGFAPGLLDLVFLVWVISWIHERRGGGCRAPTRDPIGDGTRPNFASAPGR